MMNDICNLIFEGGGVLGVAYLGVLDYLYHNDLLKALNRTAGTSSGAIAACITCFQLPFEEMKQIAYSLDYSNVPYQGEFEALASMPGESKHHIESVFGDMNCLYRLITRYGWYSSEYIYHWLQNTIAGQFNAKKQPPYTFADFTDPDLHKGNRPFHDLYVIGTNLTTGSSQIFSYETTPAMEVANAIRISISIPLFFEAVGITQTEITGSPVNHWFCDGGIMNNYPIRLFDSLRYNQNLQRGSNMETLGVRFKSKSQINKINNLLDFIWSLALTSGRIQQESYYNSPMDRVRSINIDSLGLSPIDFNINPEDDTYQLLYRQGFSAADSYFNPAEIKKYYI